MGSHEKLSHTTANGRSIDIHGSGLLLRKLSFEPCITGCHFLF
jgi:hypothetical protein